MGKRFFEFARADKLDARQQRQTQAAQGVQQMQTGFVITLAAEGAAGAIEGHQQRTRRRQTFASLEARLEVLADFSHHRRSSACGAPGTRGE